MSNPIQNQYAPDVVSPPGETLLEILEDRGMSQAELAERTGRPKKTINEIIKGKAALTPETAIQLERVLGTPASFWNNREQNYRDWLARQEERKALAEYIPWMKKFPLRAIIKLDWIAEHSDRSTSLKNCCATWAWHPRSSGRPCCREPNGGNHPPSRLTRLRFQPGCAREKFSLLKSNVHPMMKLVFVKRFNRSAG